MKRQVQRETEGCKNIIASREVKGGAGGDIYEPILDSNSINTFWQNVPPCASNAGLRTKSNAGPITANKKYNRDRKRGENVAPYGELSTDFSHREPLVVFAVVPRCLRWLFAQRAHCLWNLFLTPSRSHPFNRQNI